MGRNSSQSTITIALSIFLLLSLSSYSFPLTASNRFMVDLGSTKLRVKLRCANWPAHMSVMLAEGLNKQPISNIATQITKWGLNCVRLTWATYMFTRYSNQTIQQSLDQLKLGGVKIGIMHNNPSVINMTHPQAYAYVVDQLGAHNIMVVSDNHVSEPMWCCAANDGNAFFGDTSFGPHEWVKGLTLAAQLLEGKTNVVAMSLRNELRGPLQNLDAWYTNVTKGALAVHQANKEVLVVISGLYNDNDLSFLRSKPLILNLDNKVVYEVHTYSNSGERKDWSNQSTNYLCGKLKNELDNKAGFLTTGPNAAPLIMSEFGTNLITRSDPEMRWLTCVLSYLAGGDLDWAWWGLQGSYYLRDGQVDAGEAYGLFNFDWNQPSYDQFTQQFQLLLKKLQDPISKAPNSNFLYHPQSGQCAKSDEHRQQLMLSTCDDEASGWSHEGDKIKLNGTLCLMAFGNEAEPVVLSTDCSNDEQTNWKFISSSGLHLAMGSQGNGLCLEKYINSSILLINKCICVDGDQGCMDNPQSQWFQLVPTNVQDIN